eukprot:gene5203-6479_t
MISLKESFKFTNNWVKLPPQDIQMNVDQLTSTIVDEAETIGAFENICNVKVAKVSLMAAIKYSIFAFPEWRGDDLKISMESFLWIFLTDDSLDKGDIDDCYALNIVKRIEHIFLEGEFIDDDPSGIEKYTLFLRNRCLAKCHEKHNDNLEPFNSYINLFQQWLKSIVPFNRIIGKLSDFKDLELFNFIRNVNVGGILLIGIYWLVTPTKLPTSIGNDPRLFRMCELHSMVISYINDPCSYAKEKCESTKGQINLLVVLQKSKKWSIHESFDYIASSINEFVREFDDHEEKLMKSISNLDAKKQKVITEYVNFLKYSSSGSFYFSINTSRYSSKSTPFLEINNEFKNNLLNNEFVETDL